MIKQRRFTTGLGTGVIIGAILLQLMNIAAAGTEQLTQSESEADAGTGTGMVTSAVENEQQLSEAADRLGYHIYKKSVQRYTQEQLDEQVRIAVEQIEQAVPEAAGLSVTITSGMTAEQVAEALLDAKLIDDVSVFLKELARRQLTYRIEPGVFEFESVPVLSELITRITLR